jgi:hypothetical protein
MLGVSYVVSTVLVHFGRGADTLSAKGTLDEFAIFKYFRLLKVRTKSAWRSLLRKALVAPKLGMLTTVFTLSHR